MPPFWRRERNLQAMTTTERQTSSKWNRVVRQAVERVAGGAGFASNGLNRVALNPQPLPPRSLFLAALSQTLISSTELLQEFAGAMLEDEERSIIVIGSYVNRFVEDFCGNGFRVTWVLPGPPPQWFPTELTGADLLVLASHFAQATKEVLGWEMQGILAAASARFAEVGVQRMQAF
jgi:hypothetical protein